MDDTIVVAAQAGDHAAFGLLTEPYRRELQVHCYRMLGSLEDAEDAVQETYLRAWTRLDSFAGRGTLRAWLYSIATRACLDALRRRKARRWPPDVSAPSDPRDYPAPPADVLWLQPYPDSLLAAPAPSDAEPEAAVTSKETIELAFLASIQRLPARQRAVLILREVLDWPAADVAHMLEISVAAVNSAQQRARATLREQLPVETRDVWPTPDISAAERSLLHDFIAAHESGDSEAMLALIRDDIRVTMPPAPYLFEGRDAFAKLLERAARTGDWRLVATRANRQPAAASYLRTPGGTEFRAYKIDVLHIVDGALAEITTFGVKHFPAFGLPPVLPRPVD
jgi:RNA polymerase sigma-70 factor, ECF subfamily